ncbi:MAG: growth inhibitor PemK [Candidatus Margulisbacteria bacterium GWF2_35_9]|nr:MAG: growth inhibitor PemK [Candidatus Margulisbacteria bacterium GWF2_35_9]
MGLSQYDVCLVQLDPTVGKEIKKTRPCLILSPDEMNEFSHTIIIAPMTTKDHLEIPTRIRTKFQKKIGWIALDQLGSIDKRRITKTLGAINRTCISKIKAVLKEMLID